MLYGEKPPETFYFRYVDDLDNEGKLELLAFVDLTELRVSLGVTYDEFIEIVGEERVLQLRDRDALLMFGFEAQCAKEAIHEMRSLHGQEPDWKEKAKRYYPSVCAFRLRKQES